MIPSIALKLDPKAVKSEEPLYDVLDKVKPEWKKEDIAIKVKRYKTKPCVHVGF